MQNKGAVRLFAILLAVFSLYYISFTYVAERVEKKAVEFAQGDLAKETHYLDSINSEVVYNLGIRKYTYKEVKEREINLGLDLKGGMNVTLEISVVDLVRSLSNYSKDSTFNAAIRMAQEMQKSSDKGFVALFGEAFEQIDPNARLAANFLTPELKERINFNSTNADVISVIQSEADAAIDNSFNILRSRIDRFGVAQPNIQKLSQRGRILVELPGVKDKERVRNLLQGTASLEFWETYENQEVYNYLIEANEVIKEMQTTSEDLKGEVTATEEEEGVQAEDSEEVSLLDELEGAESDSTNTNINVERDYPLFALLSPSVTQDGQLFPGPAIGFAHYADTAAVNKYLNTPKVKSVFPRDLKFEWTLKPYDEKGNYYQLIALKITTRNGTAPLDGGVVTDARQSFAQNGSTPTVSMSMNAEGSKAWARMTRDNVGRSIAIALDGYVVSFPRVNDEITGGRSEITGMESVEEGKDLANMLKSGKMPAPANIVEEYVVGPSLGQESINAGFWSFVIAFILVLLYMLFIYSYHAGLVANIALVANLFFILGVLASFGAVLTLPGIAGLVLTIGMSVDANVLIYERIQEERKAGKGLRLAISDGYKAAYSAIIDGQLTTLLTGVVLYFFGSGPIKGFATTLIIGITTSLFSAIFITRLTFDRYLSKDRDIKFVSKITANWLQNSKIKFLEKRKIAYIISGALILVSLASIFTKGFNYGIDFKGGRTYVVAFDEAIKVSDVSTQLAAQFGSAPEVKTFGADNQVRITTDYHIDDKSATIDNRIEEMMFEGLAPFIGADVTLAEFTGDYIQSSTKVGPTISDDIKKDALLAIGFSLLIIFLYILIRFSKWQYGLGAIAALAHDSIIVLGVFSIFSGMLPFSLEIDQAFIAAILTVLGYSINDTVVVFDRIREYLNLYTKRDRIANTDAALNSTLRRTFSTSVSTFVVLLAIFIFGGETIRGFTFALLIGVVVGTYSSLFIATPIAHDTQKRIDEK